MISIVIPIYNDEKYIVDCLTSVQNQSFNNFECLCLDDGSCDNTVNLINQFVSKDSRFVLYQNIHKGPGWQRNFGIKVAKGEYITFMDHDDYVEEEWLQKLYDTLIDNNVDVSFCANSDYFENSQKDVVYYFPTQLIGKTVFTNSEIPKEFVCNYFAPWRRLVRRSLLINNNICFAEGNYKFDDVFFTQLLMENVKSVAVCNEVLYHHRIFDNSITGMSFENKDVYFEHFDTAEEVVKYAKLNGKDSKRMLLRMFPFFSHYLFYVDSKFLFYKKFRELVYKNKFPLKYRFKMVKYYVILIKIELLNLYKKVKYA